MNIKFQLQCTKHGNVRFSGLLKLYQTML